MSRFEALCSCASWRQLDSRSFRLSSLRSVIAVPLVSSTDITLQSFIKRNRIMHIDNYIKTYLAKVQVNVDGGRAAEIESMLHATLKTPEHTRHSADIRSREGLMGLREEYYVLVAQLVRALQEVDAYYQGADHRLPPFEVLSDCCMLLSRTNPEEERILLLVDYCAAYLESLNRRLVASPRPPRPPSMTQLTEVVLKRLAIFSNAYQPEVNRLLRQVYHLVLWHSRSGRTTMIPTLGNVGGGGGRGDTEDMVQSARFVDLRYYADEVSFFNNRPLKLLSTRLYGLQGMSGDCEVVRDLLGVVYLSACEGKQPSGKSILTPKTIRTVKCSDVNIGDRPERGYSRGDGDVVLLALQRVSEVMFSLQMKRSQFPSGCFDADSSAVSAQSTSSGHCTNCRVTAGSDSDINSISDSGIDGMGVDSVVPSASGSLRLLWELAVLPFMYFSILPTGTRWMNIQRWYRQDMSDSISDVMEFCNSIRKVERGCQGMDLPLSREALYAASDGLIGCIDKCCAEEGAAFTGVVAVTLQLSLHLMSSALACIELAHGRETEAKRKMLQTYYLPLSYLCQSVSISLPRIKGLPSDIQGMADEADAMAKKTLLHLNKSSASWSATSQTVSEKRISHCLVRLLRRWRMRGDEARKIFLGAGMTSCSGQHGNTEVIEKREKRYVFSALNELWASLSLSSGQFVQGMSTDFVLRGYFTSPGNHAAADEKGVDRTIRCVINVEVDGLHHQLGRKKRFQQLRDEHLTTSGIGAGSSSSSSRTVVVRLNAEAFTPLTDREIDSYVEGEVRAAAIRLVD